MNFHVHAEEEGEGFRFDVRTRNGGSRSYQIPSDTQQDFSTFYRELSHDFGTRMPHVFEPAAEHPSAHIDWQPLLTTNIAPRILVGYGDPAVFKDGNDYWLTATSNDAPDAFPILHSRDLVHWECRAFVFPEGSEPDWAATGPSKADFWAPEMHKVGDEYWLAFTARQSNSQLAIGLARAGSPLGPWVDNGAPLVTGQPVNLEGLGYGAGHSQAGGGVIDSHLFIDRDGRRYLFWKDDTNSIWPRPLAMLLRRHPDLIEKLFENEPDRKTADFAAAIVPWANLQRPMVRFFLMHPLIEAALANWAKIRETLQEFGLAAVILEAMTTPIRAQRIADDGRSLTGENRIVLSNDLDWEGHLIEGPFVTRQEGRYWLFYAGNDFSTPSYGVGVAVADDPFGPYSKQGEPLLRSSRKWLAPGHASVAPGLTGRPQLFFHAFHPGTGGYNAFRALMTVGLNFDPAGVEIVAVQ